MLHVVGSVSLDMSLKISQPYLKSPNLTTKMKQLTFKKLTSRLAWAVTKMWTQEYLNTTSVFFFIIMPLPPVHDYTESSSLT